MNTIVKNLCFANMVLLCGQVQGEGEEAGLTNSLLQLSPHAVTYPIQFMTKEAAGRGHLSAPHEIELHGGEGTLPLPVKAGKVPFRVQEDRILVDVNGDGLIDARDGGGVQSNQLFRVPLILGGRAVHYPVRVAGFDAQRASFDSRACLVSQDLGFIFCDDNVNGQFGERSVDLSGRQSGALMHIRESKGGFSLVRTFVQSDSNRLYLLQAPYDGDQGTLSVRCKTNAAIMRLCGVLRHASDLCGVSIDFRKTDSRLEDASRGASDYESGMTVPLPVGTHELKNMGCYLSNRLSFESGLITLQIQRGEEKTIILGPPFRMDFSLQPGKDRWDIDLQDVWLVGQAGEYWRGKIHRAGTGKPLSRVTVSVLLGRKKKELAKLEFG